MSRSNKERNEGAEYKGTQKRKHYSDDIFFLLCMQMDREIIAVIAVSISPETYGLGESGDRGEKQ